MVVDTRNWWPGKPVLVAPQWITHVNWTESQVHVRISREAVRNSPECNADATLNREYEERLLRHYEQW
jgi:hypothetical protein